MVHIHYSTLAWEENYRLPEPIQPSFPAVEQAPGSQTADRRRTFVDESGIVLTTEVYTNLIAENYLPTGTSTPAVGKAIPHQFADEMIGARPEPDKSTGERSGSA